MGLAPVIGAGARHWGFARQAVVRRLLEGGDPLPPEVIAELREASLETDALQSAAAAGTRPYGAAWYDTSEYMLGNVLVTVVLLESDGTIPGADPQSENWTEAEKNQTRKG